MVRIVSNRTLNLLKSHLSKLPDLHCTIVIAGGDLVESSAKYQYPVDWRPSEFSCCFPYSTDSLVCTRDFLYDCTRIRLEDAKRHLELVGGLKLKQVLDVSTFVSTPKVFSVSSDVYRPTTLL